MRILYALLFCFTLTLALKKSSIGKNDWSYQNVGELTHASFVRPDKILFVSDKKVYGALTKDTGAILYRNQFEASEQLVSCPSLYPLDLYFANNQNRIELYRANSHQRKSFLDLKNLNGMTLTGPIRKVIVTQLNTYILTENQLGYVSKHEFKQLSTGKLIALMKPSPQGMVTLFSQQSFSICAQNFATGISLKKHCFNISVPTQIELTNNFLIFGYFDHIDVYDLEFQHLRRIDGLLIEAFAKTNTLMVEEGTGRVLYKLTDFTKDVLEGNTKVVETTKEQLAYVEMIQDQGNEAVYRLKAQHYKDSFWKGNPNNPIKRIWIHQKTDIDMEILVQYEDLKLDFFSFTPKDRLVKPIWTREESLAYVTQSIFLEYQNEKEFSNPYYEQLLQQHLHRSWNPATIFSQFKNRITAEIKECLEGAKQLIGDLLQSLSKLELSHLLDPKKPVFKFQASDAYEMAFGLRKMLLLSTEQRTLINIDTKTSKIIWKIKLPNDGKEHIGLFRLVADQLQRILLVQYGSNQLTILQINRSNGNYQLLKTYDLAQKPKVTQVNDNALQITTNTTAFFFQIHEQLTKPRREFIFSKVEGNTITGEMLIGSKVQTLWNIQIPAEEEIVALKTSFRNQQAKLPLYDEQKVYYKNIDFTNFAVITKSQNTTMNLYIINANNGHILFNKFRKHVDFSNYVNIVYDENSVIVSYFSRMNKLFEIWVVEQYQQKTDTSAMEIINKYLNENATGLTASRVRSHIIFEQQIFGSPVFIKYFKACSSKLSLLKRNLVVITRDNQLYSIDRKLVTARRPSGQAIFESQKLPKYQYLLPIIPFSFISYDSRLCGLKDIKFDPTKLESNLFVFAYGTDLFLSRWTPEQTFDMITEDFNYLFLIAVVVGITLALMLVKKITLAAKVKRQFLQ